MLRRDEAFRALHETHRRFLEDARRFARLGIAHDLSAHRRNGTRIDPCGFEGTGIHPHGVVVDVRERNRVVRCDSVKLRACRILVLGDRVVPASSEYPFTRCQGVYLGGNTGKPGLLVRNTEEVNARHQHGSAREMGMAVDEPGQHRRPASIDDVRFGPPIDTQLGIVTKRHETPPAHREGRRPRQIRIDRPNIRAGDEEICRLDRRRLGWSGFRGGRLRTTEERPCDDRAEGHSHGQHLPEFARVRGRRAHSRNQTAQPCRPGSASRA